MTDSPTWREVGLGINQFMKDNDGEPPTRVRFNGDTGDDLLREPRFKQFYVKKSGAAYLNPREHLRSIFDGFNVEMMIDGRLPRGKIVFE